MPPKAKKKDDKSSDKNAVDEKFSQLDITTSDVRTAVIMLDTPETSIVCKSCQSLQSYMEKSDQNCIELHELNIVPRLVSLIASQEKVIVAHSILCLAAMSSHLVVKRSLLKLPVIPPLLSLLKPDEELVILERAAFIVSHLADEYTFKQQLEEGGVCQLLIGLLSHGDCDVTKNAIKSLSLLTQYYKSRYSFEENNGFPNVLPLLSSEYAIIQELTLQTLHNCLQDGQCRAAFKKADGLAKLMDFLSTKEWDDLHVLAINVLSLCLLEEGGMEALHSSDCLQRLLKCIQDSQVPQMKINATIAVSRAASDSMSLKILHEQDAEKVFISLLSSSDEGLLVAACGALAGLSSLTTSRQLVGKEGGIKALVQLLQNASASVRGAAVHCLAFEITDTPSNINLVSEAGGVEPIVSLLSDDLAATRVHAISCIISMTTNGAIRGELIEQGVMSGLVSCMPHVDTRVQQMSLEAIALLAIESSAREQFPLEEVECLLELLLSGNTNVSMTASWAVSMLAYNKQIGDAIFKNQGLEKLQQLSNSPNQKIQKYANLAKNRLLSGSPAALYHVTGHLSTIDTIVGVEFWDMGMAESNKGFVPLQELIGKPAELNRPILTVSLINQTTNPSVNDDSSSTGGGESGGGGVASREESIVDNTKSRSGASSKVKKAKSEKLDDLTVEEPESQPRPPEGVLPPDSGLMEHMTHVQRNIQPLASVQDQAERLAIYVSQVMGGAVSRSTSIPQDLPISKIQTINRTNLVPIGNINKGSFQHRSLLYKVLADAIGIPCTLTRGEYGRYWNTVLVNEGEWLIDLMYTPGKLLGEQEASYYKSI
ncbi:PREDICTED: armadillo repeat-containing protein 3-like [Amphimedon queenslandica]|uniref:Uncharacterized protein n=1 Tax=Amphimedon queenslandica TaxID=400682 RepID=A0A1X7VNF4_AMPQE|nr:PREDICTED: armadillo repeat-containing protein 3-like [Amphimedon queenslandica]|eukprot:XP_019862006.1 PREDICTED: armadillo repeat-containing protein 3-like [Amphimedon queenslandica]